MLPPQVVAAIDLERLTVVPGSFIDERLAARHTDLLYAVPTRSEGTALIYVLFEHQSTPDPRMPLRLLTYAARILETWAADHPQSATLPLVVPVVLYHGSRIWNAPLSLFEMWDPPLGAVGPDLRYVLEDLSRVSDSDLRGKAFGLLALWLFKHVRERDFVPRLAHWMAAMERTVGLPPLRAWEQALRYVLHVREEPRAVELVAALKATLRTNQKEAFVTIAEQLEEIGRRKGREEGRVDALREVLRRFLRARFGALPEAVDAAIASADADVLAGWTDRLVTAASIEDVGFGM